MACNKYKNRNYKSALQYFNTTAQAVAATDLAVNPVIIDLGATVTDTGAAFDFKGRSFDVCYSGLYAFETDITIDGTAAGDVTFAIVLDGVVLPETVRTITQVADVEKVVHLSTVRQLKTCCSISEHNVYLIAYSDGTGTGTIVQVSGNAIKEA